MNDNRLGPVQIGIILLAVATALIHLALGVGGMLWMFILNGVGYLVLVAALFVPQLKAYKGLVRWALIAFTVVTILGWVFIGMRSPIGYLTKLIEVALIVLLFVDMRQPASSPANPG